MTTEPVPTPTPADGTVGDPGLLYEAYSAFPEARLARVFTPDEVAKYAVAWKRLTQQSAALLGEKLASCPDSEIAAVVQDLVDAVVAATPASPYEGATVAKVKSYVGSDVTKAKEALEYEQNHESRPSLITALGLVIAEGTVGIEVTDVEAQVSPRVGSVIDTVGGEQEAGSTS